MPSSPRRALVTAAAALTLGAATLQTPAVAASSTASPSRQEHVTFTEWDFGARNPGGTYAGTRRAVGRDDHALELETPTGTRSYTDPFASTPTARQYDEATWTSPRVTTSFGLDELVASWNAHTPGGSWIETSVQGVADDGTTSKWYVLGRWADDDTAFHPTSVGGQRDDLATVSVDTLVARNGHTFDSYRIKLALLRPAGSTVTPSVDMVGAMASHVPDSTARRSHRRPP